MKRILISILFAISILTLVLTHVYASFSITNSNEYKMAKSTLLSEQEDVTIIKSAVYISNPNQYIFLTRTAENVSHWNFIMNEKLVQTIDATKGIQLDNVPLYLESLQIPKYNEIYQATPALARWESTLDESPYLKQFTQSEMFWEIIGKNEYQKIQYTYIDFYNGHLLWSYQLQ